MMVMVGMMMVMVVVGMFRKFELTNLCNPSVVERERGRASRPWRNIFPGSRSRSGTQREVGTVLIIIIVNVIVMLMVLPVHCKSTACVK